MVFVIISLLAEFELEKSKFLKLFTPPPLIVWSEDPLKVTILPAVEEVKLPEAPKERKRVRPPKTGKVFLGKEEMREWGDYVSWLKNEQGLKNVRHKKI